jgi:DNA-binding Xre family transcriptional regulator
MFGKEVFGQLQKKLGISTARELAQKLGFAEATLCQLQEKNLKPITISTIICNTIKATQNELATTGVKAIVEFYPISKCESSHGIKMEFLDKHNTDEKVYSALRAELSMRSGLYIFYNSEGKLLYIGKTKGKTNSLWDEIKSAYNRERVPQILYLTRTRLSDSAPFTSKIKNENVFLHDISAYFSAYYVHDSLIDIIEALLIRITPNNNMNDRIESIERDKK